MKKIWILAIILLVIGIPFGYYTISPIFRVIEKDDASPLEVNDAMDSMDAETKVEFERQMEAMKDKIVIKNESMHSANILAQGEFEPRAHEVKGKALLIESGGKKIVRFEDFDTINGPDLRIYLSSDLGNDDFIELSKIKATKGNVNYEIPDGVDISKYNKVLVWCKAFGVLFSYADLS
jgi:hypothetical protein